MAISITEKKTDFSAKDLSVFPHVLVLMPKAKALPSVPGLDALKAALKRREAKIAELAKSPVAVEIGGTLLAYAMVDGQAQTFERHTQIRKAWECLASEKPESAAVVIIGDADFRKQTGHDAAYVLAVNAQPLPAHKSKATAKALKKAVLFGVSGCGVNEAQAIAEGNTLTRSLTVLPPNELTPGEYRKRIKALAKTYGWSVEEYGFDKLKKMGAGAFCAVAQGSPARDAAIVHIKWEGGREKGEGKKKKIALVGKGICFDTGGHNLKPAKYMHGMHEDMNGSAVVLGIMAAASKLKLPVAIDGWLALAENHISPQAYRQNEVVKALNGTTIEVMHTDAEGRMVLADTLTLASKRQARPRSRTSRRSPAACTMRSAAECPASSPLPASLHIRLRVPQQPVANALLCFLTRRITTAALIPLLPMSSSALWKAGPTTSWRRVFCRALLAVRNGCTWTFPPVPARADWGPCRGNRRGLGWRGEWPCWKQ